MAINFPLDSDKTRVSVGFEIISDQSLLDMMDLELSTALKSSGWKDGQWVKTGSSDGKAEATTGTPVRNSFVIFTGSEQVSDPTTDTAATGKISVVSNGGYIAVTDQYAGTPAVGTLLVAKSGVLAAAGTGEESLAVAVVVKPISGGKLTVRAL